MASATATAGRPIAARGRATEEAEKEAKPWGRLLITCLVGMVFVLVNFPRLLQRTATSLIADEGSRSIALGPVHAVQSMVATISGPQPNDTFQTLISYSFIGLMAYLTGLAIFSLRHWKIGLLGWGVIGLAFGVTALHIISWIALIALRIILWVNMVLHAISHFVAKLLAPIVYVFVRYGVWIVAAIYAGILLYRYRKYFVRIACALGLAYILFRLVPGAWSWLTKMLGPLMKLIATFWQSYIAPAVIFVFALIVKIVAVAIVALGVVGVLSTLGHLVIDQIKAAWHAGSGRKGVLLGAFSIGTAFSLVILTTVANPHTARSLNAGWTKSWELIDSLTGTALATGNVARSRPTQGFENTMPAPVRKFAFQYLTSAGA